MTPAWTMGVTWLAPPSFMFQAHFRVRFFTLSGVICLSGE